MRHYAEPPLVIDVSTWEKSVVGTECANKNARRLKKSCSLNIKAIMLKTALFYPRYVKLGSVIYPALISHSFPSKYEIFCRRTLSKTCKNERKQQANFPFVLLLGNNDSLMCSCILSSWENGIPLNKLSTLGGRLFNPPKRKHMLKRAESHRCEVNTLGIFACNFSTFFLGFSKGFILENRLQNLNGVTDFSQENF